ncbi:MAG: DUF2167 domain-containing protein [Verrucomicrobiota bacterium]
MKSLRFSVFLGLAAFSLASSSTFSTRGEDFPLSARPDPINWIVGPTKADLGSYAEIQIPEGYRFAGTEDARALLKVMKNPVPNGLAGIMAPVSGNFLVIFEDTAVGYVKDAEKGEIDSKAVLKLLQKKVAAQNTAAASQAATAVTSIGWQMEPRYDRSRHILEWAIQAQSGNLKSINHVVRLFGRAGVLDGIAVQSSQSMETVPLKDLMAGITFKAGAGYADYRKGDKVSEYSVAQLIAADGSAEADPTAFHTWAYAAGGVVLLLIGGGILVLKRGKHSTTKKDEQTHLAPLAKAPTNGAVQKLAKTDSTYSYGNHVNGHSTHQHNGKINGHGKNRRKRIFDYQRYYSDLMFQVSDRAYETDVLSVSRNNPAPELGNKASETISSPHAANLGLIESQKRLIEEQQRLIREQTKLIEEKTRLIQEKNQVLDKQSELFGNNIF